jgi:hypothetical protein
VEPDIGFVATVAGTALVRGRGGTGTSPTAASSLVDALGEEFVPQIDDQSWSAAELLAVAGGASRLRSPAAGGGGNEGPVEVRVDELLATRTPPASGGVASRGGASSGRMLLQESGVVARPDGAPASGAGFVDCGEANGGGAGQRVADDPALEAEVDGDDVDDGSAD